MRALLFCLTCLAVLSGCGNKGDLHLRDPIAPPQMSAADRAAADAAAQAEAARTAPVDEDD
jgi:predicted small lipoprotein YifL